MSVRHALLSSVCSALLAATAAAPGAAAGAGKTGSPVITQAYQALAAGDTKTAIKHYSAAIDGGELQPEALAGALLNRGLAHQQSGEHQKAVDDYTAALRLDAMNVKLRTTALYNRGLSFQKLKQVTLAIDDFTNALFLDSEFSYAYYARGNALRDSGQYLFALSDFEKARRFRYPSLHLAFYGEALTFEQLKRQDEAIKALEKAIAVKPDFEAARKKLTALGGKRPAQAAAPQIDSAVTGSLVAGAPDQVVRKLEQPDAVAPPPKLLAALKIEKPEKRVAAAAPDTAWTTSTDAAPSKKRYTDRILPEDDQVPAPKQKIVVNADPPPAEEKQAEKAAESVIEETAADETATASISPAETADDSETAATAEPEGWSVQLTSEREEQSAWNTWTKLKSRHALLRKKEAVVIKADLGAKGIYYRLRLAGYGSQNAAKSDCSRLKSKGVSCFVSRVGG
jgi:Tfp pilus assembly protein PilF